MSAQIKALFIVVLLLAAATVLNAAYLQRPEVAIALGLLALGLSGLAWDSGCGGSLRPAALRIKQLNRRTQRPLRTPPTWHAQIESKTKRP